MPQCTRRSSHLARLSFVLACACAAALLVVACSDVTAPLPTGAIEWNPPARFALWWQMTESCSGRQGDLRAIRWYIVPGATSIDIDGKSVQGVTIGNRIVLADAYRLDGSLVRHEMLHALLRGENGHPRDAFLVACNDVVVCDSVCEADAGGRLHPPADAPELLPHDVVTRVEVVPRQPAASKDSGAVAFIVSITNPRATPVWVRLTPPGSSDAIGLTFGLAIDYGDTRGTAYRGQTGIRGTRFPLLPNETRRYVWDTDLTAGTYGIRGWFNADTASRFTLNVAP
jgi:hypothetical protein